MARERKTAAKAEAAAPEPEAPSPADAVVAGHEAAVKALDDFEQACNALGPDRLHGSLRTILDDYRNARDDIMALVDRIKSRAAA